MRDVPTTFREMRPLRADQRIATPWKNGGGFTHEVAVYPAGASWADFGWRISIASMPEDNAFSTLPCIDRTLAVLEGALQLTIDGKQQPILYPTSPPVHFDGASIIEAVVVSAPVLNLNLMVRRGVWAGYLMPLHDAPLKSGHHRLLIATGPITLDRLDLDPLDALQIEPNETMPEMPASARGWMAEFRPAHDRA
jgi:uncharacterized protein